MKKIILALMLLLVPSYLWAVCGGSTTGIGTGNLTAYDHSYDCVNLAVNTDATYGDIVNVPAGDGAETWASQLKIVKGITLKGPGANNLTITGTYAKVSSSSPDPRNYLISYEPNATSLSTDRKFRITGFTINTGTACFPVILYNTSSTIINNVIIDHNTIIANGQPAIEVKGMVNGVISSNTISATILAIEFLGSNKTSWERQGYYPGTANGMYVEDNIITATNANPQVFGWAGGGLGVVRYNTINHAQDGATQSLFDIHGNLNVTGNYAGIAVEIYGNKLVKTYTNRLDQYFYHRGGAALFFYNSSNSTYSGDGVRGAHVKPYEEVNETCMPTTGVYPSGKNQVTGQGQDAEFSYYWNNRTSNKVIDVPPSMSTDDKVNCCYGDLCTYNTSFVCTSCGGNSRIKFDRDIFIFNESFNGTSGTGCGTLAARPATCTPGDGSGPGYWATDQACNSVPAASVGANPTTPLSGDLYRCTAAGWTKYFTPYKYPHPLTAPEPPRSLKIQ